MQISTRRVSLNHNMNHLRPLTSPPMDSKITQLAKSWKRGPPNVPYFDVSLSTCGFQWFPWTLLAILTVVWPGLGTPAPARLRCRFTASGSQWRLQIFHFMQDAAWLKPQHQNDISWLPMSLKTGGNFHGEQANGLSGCSWSSMLTDWLVVVSGWSRLSTSIIKWGPISDVTLLPCLLLGPGDPWVARAGHDDGLRRPPVCS